MLKKLTLLTLASVLVLVLLAGMANADITTDLMGYWKLDDNANDSSGNGYHGEEFGNPSYVPGIIDQAMEFNGTDQSVYIPDFTGIQNQDAVTVCMWVKADRNTGEDQVMWFSDEDGSYGRVRFGINGDEWEWKHGDGSSNPNADDGDNPIILGEWTHLVGVRQNGVKLELFVNGISAERIAYGNAGVAEPQASIGAERRSPTSVRNHFDGVIDEVRFYTRALSVADIQELYAYQGASPVVASNPDPPDGQTDVPRDAVLSWKPGGDAEKHDVYLGTNFDDVNAASTTVDPAGVYQDRQDPSQFPVFGTFRLETGATYYWRIDGVGAAPDNEIYRGKVWQFTAEPYAFAIDGGTIAARASSNVEGKGPENTVNGSGLDETGLLHGTIGDGAMWLSSRDGEQPTWIEYDLGKAYKLHEMWIWNSNEGLETMIGIGFQEVLIEYSADGAEFKTLGTTHEFAQAPGAPDYAHNTTVDLGGIAARHIRLTANSNWFDILEQYSLSEVRFFYIPVHARRPKPGHGETDVPLDVTLGWTAGREAAEHNVYLSTSEQAVIDGTEFVAAVTEAGYGPLSLNYATTYYWQVDEVNDLEDPAVVEGDIWSFTTKEFLVIDDFELYDSNDNQIWWAWKDGLGYVAHDSEPAYPGNGTGSEVGDGDTGSYTEEGIVHSGAQSMPYWYNNNKADKFNYSEAELKLTAPRDWTEGGVAELSLWFRGSPASVGSFTEGPVGTYTITATGADIYGTADEFHYAYKMLTGAGSIIARVESVKQTDDWAKAGVMVRETLDAGSKFAAVYIMPTNTDGSATNGCRFQARKETDAGATSDSGDATTEQMAIIAPYWVKLERDIAGNFRGYYSSDGSTWKPMVWNPQNISMTSNVYIGLALTSHDNSATCEAVFSNVTITSAVGQQWTNQDIGILSNDPEPMYVTVSNSAGDPVVVDYDDPAATQIGTWTEWIISLQDLAVRGLNLTDVDRIAIGVGTRGNMTVPGGSGKMLFDDIRLYGQRDIVVEE